MFVQLGNEKSIGAYYVIENGLKRLISHAHNGITPFTGFSLERSSRKPLALFKNSKAYSGPVNGGRDGT